MDWIVEDTAWSTHDLRNYRYEERHTLVIRKVKRDGEVGRQLLSTRGDWDDWFEKAPSSSATVDGSQPSLLVLLCSRAPPIFENHSSPISYLPFDRDIWHRLTREFHVHRGITRAISRRVTCFSSSQTRNHGTGGSKISVIARMSAYLPDDLALSVTYFPETHRIFVVVYGCNPSQTQEIEKRIKAAGSKTEHPYSFVEIFAELERKRLIDLADALLDRFTLRSEYLENRIWNPSGEMGGIKTQDNLKLCFRSRELVDNIRAVKRQLSKFVTEIDLLNYYLVSACSDTVDPEELSRRDRLSQLGYQIIQRIQDIMIEYDDKIDECNMLVDNTSLAMQTVWSHHNTQISRANTDIAFEMKREGAQMKSIALLTMIYLPLSCVASIFSMTMFNWGAGEGEPVVSQYIWVFIVLSAGLTGLTLLAWRLGTYRIGKRESLSRSNSFNV